MPVVASARLAGRRITAARNRTGLQPGQRFAGPRIVRYSVVKMQGADSGLSFRRSFAVVSVQGAM